MIDNFDLMGVQFDRLRYEVFQNLFLSPMNTGLLRPAVATTPTVYGIIRKIKYSKINKNHGKCRGFLFPSFSDYFARIKPHIM